MTTPKLHVFATPSFGLFFNLQRKNKQYENVAKIYASIKGIYR
jgi:hypothetical protein